MLRRVSLFDLEEHVLVGDTLKLGGMDELLVLLVFSKGSFVEGTKFSFSSSTELVLVGFDNLVDLFLVVGGFDGSIIIDVSKDLLANLCVSGTQCFESFGAVGNFLSELFLSFVALGNIFVSEGNSCFESLV